MENKISKEQEDRYFLQLEQEMKKVSDEADDFFWFNYLKEQNKNKNRNNDIKSNWYEILLIVTFITLWFLSIYLERNFINVILRITTIYFLSWFSSKSDIPIRHQWHLLYHLQFLKTKRLYTILTILTIIFIIIYGNLFLFALIPICWFIWLFLWRFITEIKIFIVKAIKWEVNWKSVLIKMLTIATIWIIFRFFMILNNR